jgi:hypothetical protein
VPEGAEGHAALQNTFIQQTIAVPTLDKIPAIAAFRAGLIPQDADLIDGPAVREVRATLAVGHSPRIELRD